ncbi:MAG: hypothetical protein ABI615_14325 [Chthoniobacterales bacterium]
MIDFLRGNYHDLPRNVVNALKQLDKRAGKLRERREVIRSNREFQRQCKHRFEPMMSGEMRCGICGWLDTTDPYRPTLRIVK